MGKQIQPPFIKLPKGVERYEFEERAAIKEYCGKIPRVVAEAQALAELTAHQRQQALFDNTFTKLLNPIVDVMTGEIL